jgi:hypothetical protein
MILLLRSTQRGTQLFTRRMSCSGDNPWQAPGAPGTLGREMARVAVLLLTVVVFAGSPAEARRSTDGSESLVEIAKKHRASLQASVARREREARAAAESLDRNSTLYARGLITREELNAAAREAGHARVQLESTRQDVLRADALLAELEARRRLARLPALRPGQYEAGAEFVRFSGRQPFSLAHMRPLEQFFIARAGRRLPVSAMGQSDVHTRLGLDHRHAVDVAVHPDSEDGRLVMAWLRERGISFIAFRGALAGAATGAHIHVGAPSERFAAPPPRTASGPRGASLPVTANAPAPTTQVMTR